MLHIAQNGGIKSMTEMDILKDCLERIEWERTSELVAGRTSGAIRRDA